MDRDKLNELLLTVQRPGRYVGGEWNAVKKEWSADRVKVCLAFPDTYEIGMSHLGIKILYGILNNRDDCLCERIFCPWPDFEKVLRDNRIELFSLESRKGLREFDIIGFSLAYELGYTNVLSILDLGNIPLTSSERKDGDPLIIAGGSSCFNPEPMADFIDAFVIGDGEEVVEELIDVYKANGRKIAGPRKKLLRALSEIEGVYVPSLYSVEYGSGGLIKNFCPAEKGVPEYVKKRVVNDLNKAFYPVRQVVPNIQIVHDRMAVEIMRGCKHACRFCQASAVYRQPRERSKQNVIQLAKECYNATGFDEISLLSLSSIDHSDIIGMIEGLNREFSGKAVSVSVPSLRIEEKLPDLPVLLSRVKKSGLTFAPEAGSERMRRLCGKNIDIEKLFKAAEGSFRAGWRHVKLYFMIGLPSESYDDILEMASVINRVSELKKAVDGRPARVNVSINPFIPKPHSAFEREAMGSAEDLRVKREILRKSVTSKYIELDFHDFRLSYLEAVFSRGDRRLCDAVRLAWKSGCRFDAWGEMFNFDRWQSAFASASVDMDSYISARVGEDSRLPWDFIHL
jgi:radical SAM family uncharacterized protein